MSIVLVADDAVACHRRRRCRGPRPVLGLVTIPWAHRPLPRFSRSSPPSQGRLRQSAVGRSSTLPLLAHFDARRDRAVFQVSTDIRAPRSYIDLVPSRERSKDQDPPFDGRRSFGGENPGCHAVSGPVGGEFFDSSTFGRPSRSDIAINSCSLPRRRMPRGLSHGMRSPRCRVRVGPYDIAPGFVGEVESRPGAVRRRGRGAEAA